MANLKLIRSNDNSFKQHEEFRSVRTHLNKEKSKNILMIETFSPPKISEINESITLEYTLNEKINEIV